MCDFIGLRFGTVNFIDALEYGEGGGTVAKISLVAGLVESLPYKRAWSECFDGGLLIAKWSKITSSLQYQQLGSSFSKVVTLD